MNDLFKNKCVPCSTSTPKMSINNINNKINQINNWELNDKKEMIFKKFNFKNFKQSIEFANIIGSLAETEGHHPDISLGWGYCLIMIHTHAINGLSDNDFILAAKIDQLTNY